MKTKWSLGLFFCLSLMVANFGFARSVEDWPTLNPKTYVSPSGVYSLTVDPTDRYGRGPADYRFTKDGKTVWERRIPYSFWDAVVTDQGHAIGYAYTHGLECHPNNKGRDDGPGEFGEFVVALFSADGKTINEEKRLREFKSPRPIPSAKGTILDLPGNRFVIRVDTYFPRRNPAEEPWWDNSERWWVYDLKDGKRIAALEPLRTMPVPKLRYPRIIGARMVPGTPLVLTQWWKWSNSDSCDGIFTLISLDDPKAKPLWNLNLDGDYSVPGDKKATHAIWERIQRELAILDSNQPSTFAIHGVKRHQRIVFSVEKKRDGTWQVRETARTPYDFPAPEPVRPAATFPQLQWKETAAVRLQGAQARKESPVHHIWDFGFDAQGNACVLTAARDAIPHLLYINQRGDVLKDVLIPVGTLPKAVRYSNPACVGGSKFVVTVSECKEEGKARCFLADFDAATVKELSDFDSFTVDAVAGFPNGRFAALTNHRMENTLAAGLGFFDPAGKALWKKEYSSYSGDPQELMNPNDVTRYGDDTIAVLDGPPRTIRFFDTKGNYLRTIDLKEAWKRRPVYPVHIAEDSQGGFVVYDFNAPMPLVRMDAKGQIQNEYTIKFSDGRPVKPRGLRWSPADRLWTTDGDVLLQLSDDGTVDRVLGEEASTQAIEPSYRATVGPNDFVYVPDRRTHAVHVFDPEGKWVGVCVPDATDLTTTSRVDHIAVSIDGVVFVSLARDDHAYVRFDAKWQRTGLVQIELKDVCQDWYFQPSGSLCWIRGFHDVYLVKDLKDVVDKINRRPDRQWLASPHAIGVAPDGSAAVTATNREANSSISTYGPGGEPRGTFVAPPGWNWGGGVAYDGQTVFFRDGNTVYVIDANNRCVGSFQLPSVSRNPWTGPFVAAGGKQLWFIDTEGLTLHKYEIPCADATASTPGSVEP